MSNFSETKIFEIFESISNVGKPKEKIELLKKAYSIDKGVFTDIIQLVFSDIKFYVNEKTIAKLTSNNNYTTNFNEFKILTQKLQSRQITGKSMLDELQNFWNKLDNFHSKWYGRILLKDLRIGVGKALLKQAISLKESKSVIQPMLASSISDLSENILKNLITSDDVLCEFKIDGFRLISIVYPDRVECYTRNKKRVPYIEEIFQSEFNQILDNPNIQKPFILDGEVFTEDWNFTMSFSPARKTKLTPEQENSLRYYVFDYLPYGEALLEEKSINMPLLLRKQILKSIINSINGRFIFVDGVVIPKSNYQEMFDQIIKQTEKYLSEGFEGSVIKLLNSPYEFKRSRQWLKVKKFDTLDLLVVGVEKSTKREDEISALIVKYKDTTVKVAGLPNEFKKKWYYNPDDIIGKIVEVKHMGETKNKKLRHPTFVRIRFDKDVPDII